MAYITYIGRHMKDVSCKGCRKVILARRGVAQNLRLDKTDDYDILVLEMRNPDGQLSKHMTPMCRTCADRLRLLGGTYDELRALYDEDMEQHYATTCLAGYPRDDVKKMVDRFINRTPLRALLETVVGANC